MLGIHEQLALHHASGSLHHAYCLVGEVLSLRTILVDFIEKHLGMNVQGNQDIFQFNFSSLGVDDARDIQEKHMSKAFALGGKKIYMITTNSMTHEAQNALLKVFEEPTEGAHFFLIIPSAGILLPTLKSRLVIMAETIDTTDAAGGVGRMNLTEASNFLKLPLAKKIAFVDELAAEVSDEVKTKQDAIAFLNGLEKKLATSPLGAKIRGIRAILKAQEYMHDRSASVKQLLEYVAMSV